MPESQFRALKRHLTDYLTKERMKVSERNNAMETIYQMYRSLEDDIVSQNFENVYSLHEMSNNIFQAAIQEMEENEIKFVKESSKENRKNIRAAIKTNFFDLSINHLRNCSRKNIDNNTVPWIEYSLKMLKYSYTQSAISLETSLSSCIGSCASNSKLYWIEHNLMKRLWDNLWNRIENRLNDSVILSHYIETVVTILENVEPIVLEPSIPSIIRKIIAVMKAEKISGNSSWSHSKKFAYAYLFSFLVGRWGVETRDLLIVELVNIIPHLISLITVEPCLPQDSKFLTMKLFDDTLKLAIIGKIRTVDEEVSKSLKYLTSICISSALKSAHSLFFNRQNFSIDSKYIGYIASWMNASRNFASWNFDCDETDPCEMDMFCYEGIVQMEFGENIFPLVNRCNAWNFCINVLKTIIDSSAISSSEISRIISILWKKRKLFATDNLRSSFCLLLSSTMDHGHNIKFGYMEIPSVDSILKYALSLMSNLTTLPSSSFLAETMLRVRATDISKDMYRLICDTISRISSSSLAVHRVISAFVANIEFDENAHFCNILNNEQRPWTFRKDIIDWLLSNPHPTCHQLIIQLYQFHPMFCYEHRSNIQCDDNLLESIKKLNLVSWKKSESNCNQMDIIQDVSDYAESAVSKLLETDFTLTSFLINWEVMRSIRGKCQHLEVYSRKIDELSQCMEETEYRDVISSYSKWPTFIKFPERQNNCDTLVEYIISNLRNSQFSITRHGENKEDILNRLLEKVKVVDGLNEDIQQSVVLNDYVKHFIFSNVSDIYETAIKFRKYAVFLSPRNLSSTAALIMKTTSDYLKLGKSIEDSDAFLIEEIVTSTSIRLASPSRKISGYYLDPYCVAFYPHHVEYDERNMIMFLKQLKNSPYLAQNIVRHVLTNGDLWRLHVKVLQYVFSNEKLLVTCISTIPRMRTYFKLYQFNFDPKNPAASILKLNVASIERCQKYVKKPKIQGRDISVDDMFSLFGGSVKIWTRICIRFWKIFEQEPHLICEVLYNYAKLSIKIGLVYRTLKLIRAIANCEFRLSDNKELDAMFVLICRSVFRIALETDSRLEILELCWDVNFRADYSKNYLKRTSDVFHFESDIALQVELFLKSGIGSDIELALFGIVEFYQQLNENITMEIVELNEKRGIYIIDTLSSVWNIMPHMRRHIIPIVSRFRKIWKNFPQPSHSVADEHSFLKRLRFHLALQIMSNRNFQKFELAANILVYLCTHNSKWYDDKFLNVITKLYGGSRVPKNKNVVCQMASKLRNFSTCCELDKRMLELTVLTSSIFKSVAIFVVPFLFFICVNFQEKYDYSVEQILALTLMVETDDSETVTCLAECVDSVGLNVLSMCERVDDTVRPQFGVAGFYSLSTVFLKHGFYNHAFAIANLIFDRISIKYRNLMMIERISVSDIPESSKLIDLLVQIYVAEKNAIALSSLPSNVQERSDILKITLENSKDWLKLIKYCTLDEKEITLAKWKCGIEDCGIFEQTFLDLLLRCRFTNYPKHPDTYSKIAYLILFHLGIPSSKLDPLSFMESESFLSIDDFRLIMIAAGNTLFEPITVEENAIGCVRLIREASRRRIKEDFSMELNQKTESIKKVAKILLDNRCFDAAIGLFKEWEEECQKWPKDSVDLDLIEIFRCRIDFESGNVRTAETNLRLMFSRLESMSDEAVCEYSLIFGDIIFLRNEYDETIRLLEMGAQRLKTSNSIDSRLRILLKFHSLCMDQLSRLEEYRESLGFRMKVKAISAFEEQIKVVSRSSARMNFANDEESRRTVQRVRREQQCEKDDVENVERSVATATLKAISSAFDALDTIAQLIDVDDGVKKASLIIFPLIDLMYKYETNVEIVGIVKSYACTKLVSRLWLCATSHIASKCFSGDGSMLKKSLYYVLARLVLDYPYHVLHILLMYESGANGAEVRQFIDSMPKKKANRDLVRLEEIIGEMRLAHSAYKQLAKLDVKSENLQKILVNGKSAYAVPKELKIFKCKLQKLPIPIISQPVGKSGDYSLEGIVTWKSWKHCFTIADGLSAPKIWEIQGSDGKWYKTVWKKDDVRQDVLVEQMFNVTNNMLNNRILRTYNVVPIDTECGIIEFCGGTISIKELLCGTNRDGGLHRDMNPNEPSATSVSIEMKNCQKESADKRRDVFVKICKSYSPVFRHFFYSNFPTAHIWRQKIDEYRKSLASWSVVCYIVGLGDRHASNILFDQQSCHFVHIDLGMILEYSKRTLPVPEQVPFRLSRDFLDPILIEGIEYGHLAEICNVTIEKLKKNSKVILGVASALLRETMANFRETEVVANRPSYISEMAIRRLREKLDGTDHGVSAQSSDVQIRRLLKEATSSDNLSRMFCGWMPFL